MLNAIRLPVRIASLALGVHLAAMGHADAQSLGDRATDIGTTSTGDPSASVDLLNADPSATDTSAATTSTSGSTAAANRRTTSPAALRQSLRGTFLTDTQSNPVTRPVQSPLNPTRPTETLKPFGQGPQPPRGNPFDPRDILTGSLALRPSLYVGGGATTNATSAANARKAGYSTTRAELEIRNLDNDVTTGVLTMKGSLTDYYAPAIRWSPTFDTTLALTHALTETDTLTFNGGYSLSREDASSEDPSAAGTNTVNVQVLSADFGYVRNAGIIGTTLKGSVDRTAYGTSAGTNAADRNNTALDGSLRLAYDRGSILAPFVEGGAFVRLNDKSADVNGFDRSSHGYELKGGLSLDGETATGEIAAGYGRETMDDGRLAPIDALILDGSLAWQIDDITALNLALSTSFAPTTLAGASGYVVTAFDAHVSRDIRENVNLRFGGAFSRSEYTGIDRQIDSYTVDAALGWRLNPNVELSTTASYQYSNSTATGDDTREARLEAGLTLRP
ncbi:hypothetical protein HDIA_4082 [Hartmannibacter diazotrophicus]|uniref:Outer membrane beta-barrel protein n=1 Tax=Hartmannibacter diazotrophicus TaxID=1482074 RepID=A0A2C9DBL3_9HYPH|nr:outer membrane beta-barrel protein [Hartmannibacter diazotrophicus]SON57623.1 hypothetical protein HDIA_4082 [Hartmannibacter diazotrophicus]